MDDIFHSIVSSSLLKIVFSSPFISGLRALPIARMTSNKELPDYVLLPSHPEVRTEDPLSICEDYESETVPMWTFITKLLNPAKITTIESLLDTISTVQSRDLHTLEAFLKSHDSTGSLLKKIPAMIKVALKMPDIFPGLKIPVLSPGKESRVILTREQAACLLVHMFFCTLRPPSWNKFWVDFSVWYDTPSLPTTAYLKTLLTYFSRLDEDGLPQSPNQKLIFERHLLKKEEDWSQASDKLADVNPGTGYEPRDGEVQVIFSNKDIGFGVSGTQEEVVLGMSPELCVAMLFTPTLNDNETIVIRGAEIIGRYSGFGREVKFVGPWNDVWDWEQRCLVAMDALELDYYQDDNDPEIKDLKESNIKRELNKCFCGFYSVSDNMGQRSHRHDACANDTNTLVTIATGHWGCGAFGGNNYVKALIQLMSASVAKVNLVFYDVSLSGRNTFMDEFLGTIDFLKRRETTVGELYRGLLCIRQKIQEERIQNPDIFILLRDGLQLVRDPNTTK